MQVKQFIIPYRRDDVFYLYPFGDIHTGTIHCAEAEVRAKRDEILKTPNAYWIGMGDYAEWITSKDTRWDPSQKVVADWVEQDNIAECQRKWIVKLFEPIKDKCIGLMYGNHENSIRRYNNDNVHKNICDDLGVDNLGYSCFIHLTFRRRNSREAHMVKCAFTHGTGAARTEGGRINYLKRFMDAFDAQIYGYGHVHHIATHSPDHLCTTENLMIKSRGKVGALTGCWFRTYTQGVVASYGEEKVYSPTRIGCPRFVINPDKGLIGVEVPAVMGAL